MKAAWRVASGERHAPPVEMRFVDMFMAALGALIFMAMLLAFLFRYGRQPEAPTVINNGINFKAQPFKLTTKMLPAARAGEPYEIAFAFQGGLPPAIWKLAAGGSDIPAGLKFDAAAGMLSGAPLKAGTVRFVVEAKDQSGITDSRPYELTVLAAARGTRTIENWLAVILALAVLIAWIKLFFQSNRMGKMIKMLRVHHAMGNRSIVLGDEDDPTKLEVDFEKGGIGKFEEILAGQKKQSRFLLAAFLVIAAWVIWKIWF